MTSEQPVIYESPDGGKTVYSREFGSTERTLHSIDESVLESLEKLSRELLWNNIHEAAKTNQALQIAIENVIMLYHLTENKDGTK